MIQQEEPLLRVPCDSMRKTFKNAQRALERNVDYVSKTTKDLAKSTSKVNKLTVAAAEEKYKLKKESESGKSDIDHKDTLKNDNSNDTNNSSEDCQDVDMEKELENENETATTNKYDEIEKLPAEVQNSVTQIDSMIARMKGLRTKIQELKQENESHITQSKSRIDFLMKLNDPEMTNTDSDEYKAWAKLRLEVLIADYCYRSGMINTAKQHAQCLGIEDLVDGKELEECHFIEQKLRKDHSTTECFNWCKENRLFLKKVRSNLEFELRLQHYIELARSGQQTQALAYYRTELCQKPDENYDVMKQASTLLAFGPDQSVGPYSELYNLNRWDVLADLFVDTFQDLHGLPSKSAFLRYLGTGLSALKTHSCDLYTADEDDKDEDLSEYPRVRVNDIDNKNPDKTDKLRVVKKQKMDLSKGHMCPVCSIELRKVAAPLPFAMHVKSHLESDPVVLPNNRIYGMKKLEEYSKRLTGKDDEVVDPVTHEMFAKSLCSVVYPT